MLSGCEVRQGSEWMLSGYEEAQEQLGPKHNISALDPALPPGVSSTAAVVMPLVSKVYPLSYTAEAHS